MASTEQFEQPTEPKQQQQQKEPPNPDQSPFMNDPRINQFLQRSRFAVVGASDNQRKFGHKVLQKYLDKQRKVTPVNPNRGEVCGIESVALVSEVSGNLAEVGVSIVTPPDITKQVLEDIGKANGKWVWCQPGAEFDGIEKRAKELNLELICGGPDVMAALEREEQGEAKPQQSKVQFQEEGQGMSSSSSEQQPPRRMGKMQEEGGGRTEEGGEQTQTKHAHEHHKAKGEKTHKTHGAPSQQQQEQEQEGMGQGEGRERRQDEQVWQEREGGGGGGGGRGMEGEQMSKSMEQGQVEQGQLGQSEHRGQERMGGGNEPSEGQGQKGEGEADTSSRLPGSAEFERTKEKFELSEQSQEESSSSSSRGQQQQPKGTQFQRAA